MRRPTSPRPTPSRPSIPSLLLLGAGVFLLVLAAMLAWYVEPRAERTPVDIDDTVVFAGSGSYFDTTTLKPVDGKTITVTRRVLGDVAEAKRSGRAVWDVSTTIDTPETLAWGDPRRSYQWTVARWVSDRRTNAPVHCCGETPRIEGEAFLKFPFDLEKRQYRWWDETLGAAIPLDYGGTTKVLGHRGYRFTGTVPDTRIGVRQVPGALVGLDAQPQVLAEEWYANAGVELVVDQRTGRVIDAKIAPRKTLRAPGATTASVVLLNSERIAFTPQTRRHQVDSAKRDDRKLIAIGRIVPLSAAGLGAVPAALGVVFLVRGPRRASGGAPGDDPGDDRDPGGDTRPLPERHAEPTPH
ncbi:hypothetical protein B4N89_34455 [Embleya scabrispora]|uniref:DUF3068 domain-containing protein n=1 Tax=Embleya scabrispora TaxID=159449 RepID=A0A1T3NRI1_9ACTN|nr:DUF3068 domain-containing protein [Embleya scabrispora]OPC79507.1 hypothetical protein B4N89_34455 [Embleya scabrispora]